MADHNTLATDLAMKIHAAHTAIYYPYQEKPRAQEAAGIIRNMGYNVSANPHGHVYDINIHPEDLGRLKLWFKSHPTEVISAALDLFDKLGKFIPKQVEIPVTAAVALVTATSEASASTGDPLTRANQFLNTATNDVGGKPIREMVNGNFPAAQRDIAEMLVPGADLILRPKEVQAVIDALPENKAILASLQSDMKRAPIDRHLAEYQLQYLEAKEKGNVIDGISAASTLTNLAEMKVKLEAQWKIDAETFTAATKSADTNWAQFKEKYPQLVIQADLHTAAQASGHPQAFITRMDEIIANNTGKGTPMQPIAEQLKQLQPQANIDSQAAFK